MNVVELKHGFVTSYIPLDNLVLFSRSGTKLIFEFNTGKSLTIDYDDDFSNEYYKTMKEFELDKDIYDKILDIVHEAELKVVKAIKTNGDSNEESIFDSICSWWSKVKIF